jgi:WD40 repeat protein
LAAAGQKLADDCVIRIWDLDSEDVQILDAGDGKGVWMLSFTPEGRLLSGGWGGLRLWNLDTGNYDQLVEDPSGARLSPDGRYVLGAKVVGTKSSVFVYDLRERTSRELSELGPLPWSLAWHPGGQYVAVGSEDGVIRMSRVEGGEPHLFLGHSGLISDLAFDPEGSWIASVSRDGTLRIWPLPEGQPFHTLPHGDLLAKLRALTNYRVLPDRESISGYRLSLDPFPGWDETPTW